MTANIKTVVAALICAFFFAPAAHTQIVSAPAYNGPKKTIAVDLFQATESVGGTVTAEGMTAMLTEALASDGRFVVVERSGAAGVNAEQQAAKDGTTTRETSAGNGQLIGASAIVRAAVTKFEAAAGGKKIGIGGLPLGSMLGGRAGLKSQKAVMEISLRLIDTSTGQIIATSKAQGTATSSDADVAISGRWSPVSLGAGSFHSTPIGKAGEQAIIKAVQQISLGMENLPWSALVVDAVGGKVYINAGSDQNMRSGMTLNVYRKGKTFTDPGTGVVLDVQMESIGVIQIDNVRERLSTALLVSGLQPARGDILKLGQ